MAKRDTSRGGAKSGDDSLDFTEAPPGQPAAARRRTPSRKEPVKAPRSSGIRVPVLIVGGIVVVAVFVMANRSSKEVVTAAPPGKSAASQKTAPSAPASPQTAAPAQRAPASSPAKAATAPPQPAPGAGGHRQALPDEFRKALIEYASKPGGKAIALALDAQGRYGYGSVSGFATHEEAIKEALSDCERYKSSAGVQERCKLYAMGDKIVWQ